MTEKEWSDLLQTYKTSYVVAQESLVGITEHIETTCKKGQTQTIVVPGSGKRGLPPFRQELMTCDRSTQGCNLNHNDKMALHFARLALERVQAIESGDEPMPDVESTKTSGKGK